MGQNQKCDICGEEELLPFKCRYCGGTFCGNHRLPEKHDCPGLHVINKKQIRYESPASSYYKDQRSYHKPNHIKNFINNLKRSYNRINPFIRYGLMLLIAIVVSYLIIVNTQVIGANDETTMMILVYTKLGILLILGILGIYAVFRLIQHVIQVLLGHRVSFWITTIAIILICSIGYVIYPSISNSSLLQDQIVGRYDGQVNTASGGYWNAAMVFDSNGKVTITLSSAFTVMNPIVETTEWRKNGNHYDIIFSNEKIYVTYDPSNDCISFPNTRIDGYTYDYSGTLYGNKKYM